MMQFKYRFQKILELKENEKDLAKVKMADAIKQEEEGYRKNEVLYKKIIDVEQLKKEKQQQGVHISELRMLEDYMIQLQEQFAKSNQDLKNLQSNVIKTKMHLQMKAQEEKKWMNLKQEQLSVHEKQAKLSEQNFFDEMASNQYYRLAISERG